VLVPERIEFYETRLPSSVEPVPALCMRKYYRMATITPHVPRVSMTTFAEYLTAHASGKIDCVREQIQLYAKPYRPGPSYYQAFKDGVRRGRSSGSDHLAMQRVVAAQRNQAQRQHYATLAEHWLALSQLHLPLSSHGQAVWATPRLTIGVRPDFAVTDGKGEQLVVKLWLKDRELGDDAARTMLRLFEQHMADIYPGATPIVVDVRREDIYRPKRFRRKNGIDAWMVSEASALAELWERLAAA
jgi:hypothetical protein